MARLCCTGIWGLRLHGAAAHGVSTSEPSLSGLLGVPTTLFICIPASVLYGLVASGQIWCCWIDSPSCSTATDGSVFSWHAHSLNGLRPRSHEPRPLGPPRKPLST